MKIRILTFFFFLSFAFQAMACFCGGPRTFCGYINEGWVPIDLIVKGEKIRNVDHGFEFKITTIYKGQEVEEVIMVWGDLGTLCRYYNSRFLDGEEYFLALVRLYEDSEASFWEPSYPFGPLEKTGDYAISICGKSYWHYSDEVSGEETELQVKACLAEVNPDCEITGVTETGRELCEIEKSELFPNPTSDLVYLNIPEAQNLSTGSARVFDDCGKQVRVYDNFVGSNFLEFSLSGLAAGIYFFEINLPELCEKRLIKRISKS